MLPESQRDRVDIVLVSPRNPLNIGAAARALANFGFSRLTVVAPYDANWREARSAIGAPELLKDARETESLAEAVSECTLVIGTGTLTTRKPEQQVVSLPALAPLARIEIERGGRIAIVFGPEKRGLTREDLSRCHLLVEIQTAWSRGDLNALRRSMTPEMLSYFSEELSRNTSDGVENPRNPAASHQKTSRNSGNRST